MCQHQQIVMQRQRRAGHVDDDEIVAFLQGCDQLCRRHRRVVDGSVSFSSLGQHVHALDDRLRGALDEQLIDAVRCLQRGAQAGAGVRAEQHGRGAAMQVGVEQDRVPLGLDAEMPGQVGGDGAGADAAARAGHGDHAAADARLGIGAPG